MRFGLAVALWAISAGVAESQTNDDFAPFIAVEGAPNVLLLNGPIDIRTPLAFRRALAANPAVKAIVLNSEGGSVQSGLLVAEEVFERKLSTLIFPSGQCLSACSFIYFAGWSRLNEGALGVHQISGGADLQTAQLNLSDILEVLGKYDVPGEVVTRMLRTPPDEMYIFSEAEVARLGINRVRNQEIAGIAQPQPQPQPQTATSQEEAAKAFVLGLVASGSLPGEDLVNMSQHVYADSVTFYGKRLSRMEVLKDKAKYAARWPIRQSAVRAQTIQSVCMSGTCIVTGIYDWSVADPKSKKSIKGSATFEYGLHMKPTPRVVSEDGKVIRKTE